MIEINSLILNICYCLKAFNSHRIYHRKQTSTTADKQEQTTDNTNKKSKVILPFPYQSRYCTKFLMDSKNHLTNDRILKSIILHKAAAAYYCLIAYCEQEKNYGSCLRYIRLAINCYSTI